MGFFSKKKPKQNPGLIIGDVEYQYNLDLEVWTFHYQGIEFNCYLASFSPPNLNTIDGLIQDINALRPSMEAQINSGLEIRRIKDDESSNRGFAVDLDNFAVNGEFEVAWAHYPSWGDLGVRFFVRDGAIFDVRWGD